MLVHDAQPPMPYLSLRPLLRHDDDQVESILGDDLEWEIDPDESLTGHLHVESLQTWGGSVTMVPSRTSTATVMADTLNQTFRDDQHGQGQETTLDDCNQSGLVTSSHDSTAHSWAGFHDESKGVNNVPYHRAPGPSITHHLVIDVPPHWSPSDGSPSRMPSTLSTSSDQSSPAISCVPPYTSSSNSIWPRDVGRTLPSPGPHRVAGRVETSEDQEDCVSPRSDMAFDTVFPQDRKDYSALHESGFDDGEDSFYHRVFYHRVLPVDLLSVFKCGRPALVGLIARSVWTTCSSIGDAPSSFIGPNRQSKKRPSGFSGCVL